MTKSENNNPVEFEDEVRTKDIIAHKEKMERSFA